MKRTIAVLALLGLVFATGWTGSVEAKKLTQQSESQEVLLYFNYPATYEMDPITGETIKKVVDGHDATYSPDLSQVLYTKEIDPCPNPDDETSCYNRKELFIANADGTGEVMIKKEDWIDFQDPRWSPTGNEILYHKDEFTSVGYLYVANVDGSSERRFNGTAGTFSPDGSSVAYVYQRDIFTENLSTGEVTQLTFGANVGTDPLDWSPNGNRIVFLGRDYNLYVVENISSNPTVRKVLGSRADRVDAVHTPVFSPDGTKIAFGGYSRNYATYVVNVDGTGLTKISDQWGKLSQWVRK